MTKTAVPILPTKLHIPSQRKTLVSRARLLNQLNAGLERKLTLVSAPAGYGKSTLLSEWAEQAGMPVAWLSLDSGENDPVRFWSYFLAALGTIPDFRSALDSDPTANTRFNPSNAETESFLVNLITAIAAIPWRFVFVLDDLQAITTIETLDGLLFLLENLPPGPDGMHLMIASRNDPPWALARLRASNQITEIRARDLGFRLDETTAFINDLMGLALTPDEITALDQRTEGWIAGLQMAAISMQNRDDISFFLKAFTGSHRFVLDYLVEEILSKQTPEILDFLLKTSILERMTGALCDSVTGNFDGANSLLHLERANLFVVALDDQRTWYRYHHLFVDLLQKQLRSSYPDEISSLHNQASQWYAQNEMPRETVIHALKTADWDYAAAVIEENILDLIQRGEMILARQWINALPEGVIRPRPILCVAQAWTSAQYATVTMAEDLLANAEATLANEPVDTAQLDPQVYETVNNQITVLQVVIARVRGESPQKQQALAREALDHLVAAQDTASRATLLYRLGLCYIDLGKDGEADRIFSQAFELGQSSDNHYAASAANYGRMVIARRHGQLHTLEAICRQTMGTNTTQDEQGQSLNGFALIMSGSLLYEWNNLDQAERILVQGLKTAEGAGINELLIKGHFTLACLQSARGDFEHLPDLNKLAENSHPDVESYAAALQVRLYLLSMHSDKASQFEEEACRWAERQTLKMLGKPAYDWEIFEKLVYARVLCRQNENQPGKRSAAKLEDVLDFIERHVQTLKELEWRGILVEVYIVMALILHHLNREANAMNTLRQALDLAGTQGYLRVFVDEGQPMRKLLYQAQAEGIHKVYTRDLLAAFDGQKPLPPSLKTNELIEPLTAREMQVLRLLNTQLSVPEIAAEIHLSPTTVRTHVQHIYQKLGVHGRIEALQKADEFRLL